MSLLLEKPCGLNFFVALVGDGPDLDAETKSDIFDSRGVGSSIGATCSLHGRSAGGTMRRVGVVSSSV